MKKSQARARAIAEGRTTYVPETPCHKGHRLRNIYGTCTACRRDRERTRYYADTTVTKDKVAAKYRKNAEAIKEKRRAAYAANREKEKEAAKHRSAEWRANNPNHDGIKKAKKKWKQANTAKVLAATIKRRAAKIRRTPAWLSVDDFWLIEQAYELAAMRTKLFGFSWHVDHVIPLQGRLVSGLHVPENLQVIPGVLNMTKANKYLPA